MLLTCNHYNDFPSHVKDSTPYIVIHTSHIASYSHDMFHHACAMMSVTLSMWKDAFDATFTALDNFDRMLFTLLIMDYQPAFPCNECTLRSLSKHIAFLRAYRSF